MSEEMAMTSIRSSRHRELLSAEEKLTALENAGVDNWEGYDIAMQELNKDEDEEETPYRG